MKNSYLVDVYYTYNTDNRYCLGENSIPTISIFVERLSYIDFSDVPLKEFIHNVARDFDRYRLRVKGKRRGKIVDIKVVDVKPCYYY